MAEPQVPEEIKAQTTDRLLTLFAELTHRIHSYEKLHGRDVSFRAQRDLVKAEILRRCGEVG